MRIPFRKGWIGIDIGTHSVKTVQVERVDGQIRVRQAAVIPRRTPWLDDDAGMHTTPESSCAEMQGALGYGARFAGRSAVCALPMHVYDFRGLSIPHGDSAQRRMIIAGELADTWAECEGGCNFDYWETDIPGVKLRQDEPNVNIMAVSEPWARQLTTDVGAAGLRCQALEGPPLAIARAIELVVPTGGKVAVAAMDWGFNSTTFTVVGHGRPLFTRRVRGCGVRLVLEAIESSLGVTADESQHLLSSYGLPDPQASKSPHHGLRQSLADAASEPLQRLVEQLRRTLTYFHAQRPALVPSKLWLMGGGASVPGAMAYLQHQIETPIAVWQLPTMSTTHAQVQSFSPPMLAGAVALSALAFAA